MLLSGRCFFTLSGPTLQESCGSHCRRGQLSRGHDLSRNLHRTSNEPYRWFCHWYIHRVPSDTPRGTAVCFRLFCCTMPVAMVPWQECAAEEARPEFFLGSVPPSDAKCQSASPVSPGQCKDAGPVQELLTPADEVTELRCKLEQVRHSQTVIDGWNLSFPGRKSEFCPGLSCQLPFDGSTTCACLCVSASA